jgi:predicted nucleic acid-binding protein
MRLYLDSPPIIYLVEQVQEYASSVRERLSAPGLILIASELSRLECRVKPLRHRDVALLRDFDDYFADSIAELILLTRDVLDRATEIRANFGFKTPDAIHLAAATISQCDAFLTNDHRLRQFQFFPMEIM